MLLNNQEITEEIKEEIKKYLETNYNANTIIPNSMGHSKSSSRREVYSNPRLPQEVRKISNKQPNLTPKGMRKKNCKKPKNVEAKQYTNNGSLKKIKEETKENT